MVLCNVENFNKICTYLKVADPSSILKSEEIAGISDGSVHSFGSKLIIAANKSGGKQLLGEDAEEEADVRQWLEYAYSNVNYVDVSLVARPVFKDLNSHLMTRTFVIGNKRTIADIVLYQLLSKVMIKLTFQEKEQYIHLSRWFNTMQQDALLRGTNTFVTFSRTKLY